MFGLPDLYKILVFAATAVRDHLNTQHEAARCTHPAVRREWRKLTPDERAEWVAGINCLADLPHDDALAPSVDRSISRIGPVNTSGSYWDDIVYVHMDLNTKIHETGLFLPFHRLYVHAVEKALKERCGYTGAFPYWDWSIDAQDVQNSPVFLDSDPLGGLGGWGDPTKDFEMQDGGFRALHVAYPVPHILRRNFTLQPFLPFAGVPVFTNITQYANESFTPEQIRALVDETPQGDFVGFQFAMEEPQVSEGHDVPDDLRLGREKGERRLIQVLHAQGPHASVHFILGGDLAGQCPAASLPGCMPAQPTFSANEPMFFLHHGMVDKIWRVWQTKHPSNLWAFKGGSVQNITSLEALRDYPNGMAPDLTLDSVIPTDGMFGLEGVTIRDVMDTTGGFLCYVYE
ncbi:Di-copper centre-containing protein [Cubamyces sp. BRFM 1775]|nr:Di-copper centre-containing protein [Cubamyces sp. BRFM 1775]